jgi:hypothetical protein
VDKQPDSFSTAMQNANDKLLHRRWILFSALGILALWLVLSFFNRLMNDDLLMLQAVKDHGITGATQLLYEKWNTRWASLLWVNTWYSFWDMDSHPFWYHIITLDFIIGAFMRLLQSLQKRNYFPTVNLFTTICWSFLCTGALVAATYHIGDTWFWVNTSAMYGWNLGFFILAMGILLEEEKSITDLLLVIGCGIFIGGAAEPFAVLLLLSGLLCFVMPSIRQVIYRDRAFLFFLLAIWVSFGFAYAGSGHAVRSTLLPTVSVLSAIAKGLYFGLKIIVIHSPLRLLATTFLFIPFYFIGRMYADGHTISFKTYFLKYKLPAFSIWCCWVFLHAIIITKIMGDYGPARAWSSISLATVIMVAYLWWMAGKNNLLQEATILSILIRLTPFLIAGICLVQFFTLQTYSKALDQRMELLFTAKEKNDTATLVLPPLPSSGFLHDENLDASDHGAWVGLKNKVVIGK